MFEREKSVSTYMGNYLAIPHGTNEAKDEISRVRAVRGPYDPPIDWDGNEVRFAVGIAGLRGRPPGDPRKIAIIFSDTDEVDKMIAAGRPGGLRPAERGQRRMSRHRRPFRCREHRPRIRRADSAPRRLRGRLRRCRRRTDRRAKGRRATWSTRSAWNREEWSTTTARSTAAPTRRTVVAEISTADIVTTAVGPTILRFVAPVIVAGLRGAQTGCRR